MEQTDTLVELGEKLTHGFDMVTEGLADYYGHEVDRVEVTDRRYSDGEIGVDAAVHVNGAVRDVTVRAYDGGHEIVYHD